MLVKRLVGQFIQLLAVRSLSPPLANHCAQSHQLDCVVVCCCCCADRLGRIRTHSLGGFWLAVVQTHTFRIPKAPTTMSSAKEKFEAERDSVLKDLPDSIKAMFGTIGFCKVEAIDDSDDDEETKSNKKTAAEEYVPCLIVSPFDVPPRPVRDVYWFDYFSKGKRNKTLDKLDYLIYHYGSEDPTDCYSFISQDLFKSYEDGVRDGDHVLPARIQSKIDAGQALSEEEEQRVRGLKEMEEDLLKSREERKRGADFKERYEEPPKAPRPAKRQKKS